MSVRDATCLLAHEAGIPIDRYLEDGALDRVRNLIAKSSGPLSSERRVEAQRGKRAVPATTRIVRFRGMPKVVDLFLSDGKLAEATRMAEVYPLLYVLENSIREVIRRAMTEKYGPDWWDTVLTTGRAKVVKENAERIMEQEKTIHSWHQRRGLHPIDYCKFGDLATIVAAKQDDFYPGVISNRNVFEHTIIAQVEPSRNVLCHMNALDSQSVTDIRTALVKWNRMISRKLGKVSVASSADGDTSARPSRRHRAGTASLLRRSRPSLPAQT